MAGSEVHLSAGVCVCGGGSAKALSRPEAGRTAAGRSDGKEQRLGSSVRSKLPRPDRDHSPERSGDSPSLGHTEFSPAISF